MHSLNEDSSSIAFIFLLDAFCELKDAATCQTCRLFRIVPMGKREQQMEKDYSILMEEYRTQGNVLANLDLTSETEIRQDTSVI